MNWINVKDRLPEMHERPYLVIGEGGIAFAYLKKNYMSDIAWHNAIPSFVTSDDGDRIRLHGIINDELENVTHWAEITPPKDTE